MDIHFLSPTSIDLDPKNPRLSGEYTSEPTILAELFENEDVMSLIKDIAADGYVPLDNLLLTAGPIKDRYTVIEGNRRIAAARCLITPTLAPDKHYKFVLQQQKSLSDKVATLELLPALIFDDRINALKFLNTRHTPSPVKRWSPIQQASFHYDATNEFGDANSAAIGLREDLQTIKVSNRLYSLFLIIRDNYKTKLDLSGMVDIRKYPWAIFERLTQSQESRGLLGVSEIDNGRLEVSNDEQFSTQIGRIFHPPDGIPIDTRKLNTASDTIDFLKAGLEDASTSKKGDKGQNNDAGQGSGTGGSKGKKRSKNSMVDPAISIDPSNASVKLCNMMTEMQKLSYVVYRNSAAISFRAFLQVLTAEYLKSRGEFSNVSAKIAGQPTLGEMFNFLAEKNNIALPSRSLYAVFKKAVSDKSNVASIDSLNAFAHNESLLPSESMLRDNADYYHGIVATFLKEFE